MPSLEKELAAENDEFIRLVQELDFDSTVKAVIATAQKAVGNSDVVNYQTLLIES